MSRPGERASPSTKRSPGRPQRASFVVPACNDNQDACNYSPASALAAVTVAAMDQKDEKASFSNYGKCVDVLGPGANVVSA
ncbi:S8 family serine peptidase [Streptomyces sp. NPDC049949]|uniref:S8 family serine peptidase n=1 Tax=Streptomyces sp. NPDC049949 TaxID=3154627 RepID=UPI003415771B